MSVKQLLPMALLFGIKKVIDVDNEENIPYLRIFFFGVQSIMVAMWAYLYFIINKKNDQTALNTTKGDMQPNPFGMKAPDADEAVSMSHHDYDISELKKGVQQTVMAVGLISLMHFKWSYNVPLIMSASMSLINIMDNKLLRIHIFGEEAPERPFKTKSPFSDFFPSEPEETPAQKKRREKKAKKKAVRKAD